MWKQKSRLLENSSEIIIFISAKITVQIFCEQFFIFYLGLIVVVAWKDAECNRKNIVEKKHIKNSQIKILDFTHVLIVLHWQFHFNSFKNQSIRLLLWIAAPSIEIISTNFRVYERNIVYINAVYITRFCSYCTFCPLLVTTAKTQLGIAITMAFLNIATFKFITLWWTI